MIDDMIDRFAVRAPAATMFRSLFARIFSDEALDKVFSDGKTYNATEHRLKETRTDARAPLPGRAIAVLDTRNEIFVDLQCDANAHRCERKIAEPLLERLQRGALYIADRNFSDGNIFEAMYHAKTFFIIRQHGACPSWREIPGKTAKKRGRDSRGGQLTEQWIEVRLADESWKRVRRVTVRLSGPTRNGDKEIHLLTNLPASVSTRRIANAYQDRWTIETCFGHPGSLAQVCKDDDHEVCLLPQGSRSQRQFTTLP